MRITPIALLLISLATVACSSRKPAAAIDNDPLLPQKNQVWQLTTMRGRPVQSPIILSFNTEAATLSGRATCNTYGADCRLTFSAATADGYRYTLAIANLSQGNTLCPEADMNAESRYLALLPKADAMLLTPYNLTLYQRDQEILHFELQ